MSWVHGHPGQHVVWLVDQELKQEPEVSPLNRLGLELPVVLLLSNKPVPQGLLVVSHQFSNLVKKCTKVKKWYADWTESFQMCVAVCNRLTELCIFIAILLWNFQLLTVLWVRGHPGQHVVLLVDQEPKPEPEVSPLNRLELELHVVLLPSNKLVPQELLAVSRLFSFQTVLKCTRAFFQTWSVFCKVQIFLTDLLN